MIRASHERSRFDMPESHLMSELLQHFELVGMNETFDRQVIFCRLEILAECEYVAIHFSEIVHDIDDLIYLLTEAEHDAGLREKAAPFCAVEKLERLLVAGLRSDGAIQSRNGFRVMIKDVGKCI